LLRLTNAQVCYIKNTFVFVLIYLKSMELDHLRYPVGRFASPAEIQPAQLKLWIQEIKDLPMLVERELNSLSPSDYEKVYRPDGWNIRQLIHHLADSHMNSFIRYKLALTEQEPVIKPYLEHLWSAMPDETEMDATVSLAILGPLHSRWVYMMDHMAAADFKKTYFHPEKSKLIPLDEVTALYAWHCRHHLAHIRLAKNS
jgi:hypothetical protein